VHGKFLDNTFHHCYLISDARANVWLGKLKGDEDEEDGVKVTTSPQSSSSSEEPPKG